MASTTAGVVPAQLTAMPGAVAERGLGGVSSFGASGTIAHAVLEAAPPSLSSPSGAATTPLRYKRRRFAWREAAPSAEAAAASVEAAASSHSYVTKFVPLVATTTEKLPEGREFDFILIGAGHFQAGVALGLRQHQPDARILVVDAAGGVGGAWLDANAFSFWQFPIPTQ